MHRITVTLLVCAWVCSLESGCSSTPSLMSTPTIYTRGDLDPFPDVPPSL